MDKSLGDIMKYLKEHDMDKNTVLVFMSDNGGLAISGRLAMRTPIIPFPSARDRAWRAASGSP